MTRTLSFLSDDTLDALLSVALRVANRYGWYDALDCWHGPRMPETILQLVDEYRERHARKRGAA